MGFKDKLSRFGAACKKGWKQLGKDTRDAIHSNNRFNKKDRAAYIAGLIRDETAELDKILANTDNGKKLFELHSFSENAKTVGYTRRCAFNSKAEKYLEEQSWKVSLSSFAYLAASLAVLGINSILGKPSAAFNAIEGYLPTCVNLFYLVRIPFQKKIKKSIAADGKTIEPAFEELGKKAFAAALDIETNHILTLENSPYRDTIFSERTDLLISFNRAMKKHQEDINNYTPANDEKIEALPQITTSRRRVTT